jgi:hypothetical protein
MATGPADRNRFLAAKFILGFAHGLNQNFELSPDQPAVLLERDALLNFHDAVAAHFGEFGRNRIAERRGFRAWFGRIGEYADVIEFHFFDESFKRLELRVGFPWIADDEGGSHHRFIERGTGMVDQPA